MSLLRIAIVIALATTIAFAFACGGVRRIWVHRLLRSAWGCLVHRVERGCTSCSREEPGSTGRI